MKRMTRDTIPRYAPERVLVVSTITGRPITIPVCQYVVHPPNDHPVGCPIVPTMTALELSTMHGSRWYGCDKAWINSELRMVVVGFDARDESRRRWLECKTP